MGTTLSVQRAYDYGRYGIGMCVAPKHGLVIVANRVTKCLHMHYSREKEKENLIKLSRDGVSVTVFTNEDSGDDTFYGLTALAAFPGGGVVVRAGDGSRCCITRDHCHRLEWIAACVSAALV
jgi:hypothetical protein